MKLKIHLLQDELIRNPNQSRLNQKLIKFRYDENPEVKYKHLKNSILQAGVKALGQVEGNKRQYKWDLSEGTILKKKEKKNSTKNTKKQKDILQYRKQNRDVKKKDSQGAE